jgi:hypothetical protein
VPGARGRVWTAWRVALGGLWLAVRALAARAGLTLALIALTAFAVGVAAGGAMYCGRPASPCCRTGSPRPRRSAPGCWSSGRSRAAPTYSRSGVSDGPRARIAAREGLCGHLRLRAGRCPIAGTHGQRMQAAVSPRMARRLSLRPGSRLEATTLRGEPVAEPRRCRFTWPASMGEGD